MLLKENKALSFLRNKRDSPEQQVRSECCNTYCNFEERAEISEQVGWIGVRRAMCQVSIR